MRSGAKQVALIWLGCRLPATYLSHRAPTECVLVHWNCKEMSTIIARHSYSCGNYRRWQLSILGVLVSSSWLRRCTSGTASFSSNWSWPVSSNLWRH